MIQTFFIPCRLPSLNEMILAASQRKGKWSQYAEMKRTYESLIKQAIKHAKLKPIKGMVWIDYVWVESNKRRDLDNVRCGSKFALDALVAYGILRTDGQAQVIGFTDTFRLD